MEGGAFRNRCAAACKGEATIANVHPFVTDIPVCRNLPISSLKSRPSCKLIGRFRHTGMSVTKGCTLTTVLNPSSTLLLETSIKRQADHVTNAARSWIDYVDGIGNEKCYSKTRLGHCSSELAHIAEPLEGLVLGNVIICGA